MDHSKVIKKKETE